VLRTAQDIFALDKAFFLIEGHPSREKGFVALDASARYRDLSRKTTRTIRTTSKKAFKTSSIGIICWSLL
jgi:hypothetical protein